MSDEIVFYFNPRSRAQMAHWMLEEVGAPYRIVPVDLTKREQKSPAFLALNPMGKLPTIAWRGVVVTETAAIIAFLADAFPEAGLAPAPGDPQRGPYYRWLFFAAGCVEPAVVDRMFDRPAPPRPEALGYGRFEDVVKTLRDAVRGAAYLLGERFSAADVYVGAEIYWARSIGAPGFKDEPVFERYVTRLAERPAWQRSIAEDAKASR